MLKNGFLRFCDNPEIACCKAERELEQLRAENASLRERLAESQRRELAAVEDMTKMAKCKLLGTCTFCEHRNTPDARYKPCKGCIQENRSRKNFQWRGPQGSVKGEAE